MTNKHKDVRLVAKRALLQILEPVAGFILDSGLGAAEFRMILRQAIVKAATSKQVQEFGKLNISGISAVTGISRSEVSRIIRASRHSDPKLENGQIQSTNRILSGWEADSKFSSQSGQPADLPLFGRGASFDALAKKYGLGLPTRAVLDELVRLGSVELLANQKVRIKASTAVEPGISTRLVREFGDRASASLSTLLNNMRNPKDSQFFSVIVESAVQTRALPQFRKDLTSKCFDFRAQIQEQFGPQFDNRTTQANERENANVSVTVSCTESYPVNNEKLTTRKKRINYRREPKL